MPVRYLYCLYCKISTSKNSKYKKYIKTCLRFYGRWLKILCQNTHETENNKEGIQLWEMIAYKRYGTWMRKKIKNTLNFASPITNDIISL